MTLYVGDCYALARAVPLPDEIYTYTMDPNYNYPPGVTDKDIEDWYDAGPGHDVADDTTSDEILSEMDKQQ